MSHPNRLDVACKITHTECDNPQGCNGCYHQFQQDVHNYYNGIGPLPKIMEAMRNEDREIQD